ncbi:hypothetical protein [Lacinutrix sp.]|uniref:hypothetical protein n=1 Tax=Lacinutrix sp. TaxID=1937692 RepID=UPI0035C80E07
MSEKKHIDRLFQEKFKDFEAKPSSNVWSGIQNKMEQPLQKPKKVLPLWLRFASIAAALVLLFTIGNLAFNNNDKENNNTNVVDTNLENTTPNTSNTKTINSVSNNTINTSEKTNSKSSEYNLLENKSVVIDDKSKSKHNIQTNKDNVNSLNSKALNTEGVSNQNTANTINYVASPNKKNFNNLVTTSINKVDLNTSKDSQSIAQRNSKDKKDSSVSNNLNPNSAINNNNSVVTNNKNSTNNNTRLTNENNLESTISNNNVTKNISSNSTINNDNNLNNKNTIDTNTINTNNAISNTVVATTNSDKEKEEEKKMEPDSANSSNTIEEALAKIEDLDEKEEENVDRWSVNANAAPVYYNTLGKGSHIHDQFIDNTKNGEINTSYGVNVGYALNNRLRVRSGVNKLNISYDTANVIVYENVTNTPSSTPLRNIDFIPTSNGQNISVLSSNSLSIQQIDNFINDDLNAALSQRISYFEVPLELEYAVVNKRLGVNLIGGFSTFILSDNEVVTEVDNRKTKIGEANNINNLSFSANAGIGLDYKFNKAFKFNLEPTFKYQINAYSETSGNFRPYIIGVYTGFSYKF